jgi:chemotaxis signal transduction protein
MERPASHLDQPIPEGRRDEWAAWLAAQAAPEKSAATERLFLFRLQNEWFALEPSALAMTVPYVRPRQLPHQRGKIVDGIINADGRVILCLSLERFAGVQPRGVPEPNRRLLIFSWQKWLFAAVAGEVLGVEDVAAADAGALPESAPEALRKCARGIVLHGGRAVVVLQAPAFFEQLGAALR